MPSVEMIADLLLAPLARHPSLALCDMYPRILVAHHSANSPRLHLRNDRVIPLPSSHQSAVHDDPDDPRNIPPLSNLSNSLSTPANKSRSFSLTIHQTEIPRPLYLSPQISTPAPSPQPASSLFPSLWRCRPPAVAPAPQSGNKMQKQDKINPRSIYQSHPDVFSRTTTFFSIASVIERRTNDTAVAQSYLVSSILGPLTQPHIQNPPRSTGSERAPRFLGLRRNQTSPLTHQKPHAFRNALGAPYPIQNSPDQDRRPTLFLPFR